MNWKKMLGIFIILALAALVVFKLIDNKKAAQAKVYHFDKSEAITVRADTVKIETVAAGYTYAGNFEPNKETKISAETQGKINTILVDQGSYVHTGQSLIILDHSLLKLQLQSVEVQIEGLEADVNRYTILAKADAVQGIQLEKSELGLKSAKIQRATLLEQINKSTIRAPFSGIVTAKLSEVGSFAAPGVPLLQITDIDQLKFTVNIPENELKNFSLNHSYNVTADVYPGISLSGKAIMIAGKANPGNNYPVQFLITNTKNLAIKSGMFGMVHLQTGSNEQGILIPSSAITGTAEQPQVYLIRNGKATLQNITVSKRIQDKTVVSHGLNSGDVFVVGGFINLSEGDEVRSEK